MEDFFSKIDHKIEQKAKEENLREARQKHYTDLAVSFVKKLKPIIEPYFVELKKRGLTVSVSENLPYYRVEISQSLEGKYLQLGITHTDENYIFTDFAEVGRQIIRIDESFDKSRITELIESSFLKLF